MELCGTPEGYTAGGRAGFVYAGHPRGRLAAALAMTAVLLAGCNASNLPRLDLPGAAYPAPVAEIYTRIARGALGCWFSPSGPLKRTHIFHANVAPPVDNASAEILIHERDDAAGSPRSIRAYRIQITPAPEGTFVTAENLKLPEPLATSMEADVRRWASGKPACGGSVSQAWPIKEIQEEQAGPGGPKQQNSK